MAETEVTEEPKLTFVTSLRPESNKAFSADIYRGISKTDKPYYCYRISRAYTPQGSSETKYMDWFFDGSADKIHAAAKLGDDWINDFEYGPDVLMSSKLLNLLGQTLSKADQARIPHDDLVTLQQRQNDSVMLAVLQEYAEKAPRVSWKVLRVKLGI